MCYINMHYESGYNMKVDISCSLHTSNVQIYVINKIISGNYNLQRNQELFQQYINLKREICDGIMGYSLLFINLLDDDN